MKHPNDCLCGACPDIRNTVDKPAGYIEYPDDTSNTDDLEDCFQTVLRCVAKEWLIKNEPFITDGHMTWLADEYETIFGIKPNKPSKGESI